MIDPDTSPLSSQETLAYQPISGWAIAGLAIGVLFAALVGISAVVGVVQGAPVFFPVWIMGLAIVGFVLSWIGLRHVQASEGTRAGARLARVGIWVSVVSGLCYFSYYWFTGLALQSQANDFLMEARTEDSGFFARLLESSKDPTQLNAAFLLTIPPTARAGANPKDEASMRLLDLPQKDGAPGKLTNFKDGIFGRLFFGDLARDAVITPLSVEDWSYEQASYKVLRKYHIKTKELQMDIVMMVQSSEPEGTGQTRKWFTNLDRSIPLARDLTPVGRGIAFLRERSREKVAEWINSLNEGHAIADFASKDQTRWDRLSLATGKEKDQESIKALIPVLKRALTGTGINRLGSFEIPPRRDDVGKWEQVEGHVRIYHTFRFPLFGNPASQPLATVNGFLAADSKKAIDPAQFNATSTPPEWEVSRIVITQIAPGGDRKPGM